MPLSISVVIPSFNQAAFIADALSSVLHQQHPSVETIVIDGGSTDGSVDIIRQFEAGLTHWVSEPDQGQTDALIKGFALSSGDIQCWLNSDDLFTADTFAAVARGFADNPDVDVIFGDSEWIDVNGTCLKHQREMPFNRFIWLNTYNYLPGMSVFWRREMFQKVGGLDPRFQLAMDSDLWIRFADAGARFMHVRRVWSRMRFYAAQKNQRLRHISNEEDRWIRSRYYGDEGAMARMARRATAKTARVAIRTLTGCYTFSSMRDLRRQLQ
jgi:glycosyltransferase involved in cell wall biosynthesis